MLSDPKIFGRNRIPYPPTAEKANTRVLRGLAFLRGCPNAENRTDYTDFNDHEFH